VTPILVEKARRKRRLKRGGDLQRIELDLVAEGGEIADDRFLAIDEALDDLGREDPQAARFVKLRFFAWLSTTDAAEILGTSRAKAYEVWSYARAWLRCEVEGGERE
jgi:hypothetical protein